MAMVTSAAPGTESDSMVSQEFLCCCCVCMSSSIMGTCRGWLDGGMDSQGGWMRGGHPWWRDAHPQELIPKASLTSLHPPPVLLHRSKGIRGSETTFASKILCPTVAAVAGCQEIYHTGG